MLQQARGYVRIYGGQANMGLSGSSSHSVASPPGFSPPDGHKAFLIQPGNKLQEEKQTWHTAATEGKLPPRKEISGNTELLETV